MKRLSLRFLLLRWLLPAMLALLFAGAVTAYWVAWRSATKAYDRALWDTALAVAEQIKPDDGKPVLQLTEQARAVLLADKFDQVYIAVRDPNGTLLEGDAFLDPPSGEQLAGDGRAFYNGRRAGKAVRLAAIKVVKGGQAFTILAAETLVKRNALIQEILLGMLIPELLLTLVSLSVVWFGIRAGLMPLAGLRRELAERSQADLSPLSSEVPEEIQPVVGEINELLRRLDDSLSSQRHFVSDAAHQLRTPIAALQAQVEVALRDSATPAHTQMASILAATQRLSHLIEQMLALARAEPSLAETQREVVLGDVVQRVAETWLPKAIGKHIDLGFELGPATLHGNSLLLEELLSNLLDNALRHTPAGGTVTVRCGSRVDAIWLTIDDSGDGIAEAARAQVFERFYRPPGSTGHGSGLGLAIVRQIARQHHGDAVIETSAELGGTRVRVEFLKGAS